MDVHGAHYSNGTACRKAVAVAAADQGIKARFYTPLTALLRHTLASLAISSNEAMALTGAILGHANPRSTAIYAQKRIFLIGNSVRFSLS
ncbi:hypothetical protein [Parasphingorhabdus cellanae]|uniref:Tyr recombinase domain-containing protein n=1 Tax=Parasphingorhabdus cellanae TaxID=2806553 RepID=A0ABX7TAH2_9SPHN|nr:hypothetical protein [Parasphingorhabdus cellanae]QTD57417.1 hypothetical protein J4G78_07790 [Parasphingorhabdus cellanae]